MELLISSLPFQFQLVIVKYKPGQRGLDEHTTSIGTTAPIGAVRM